MISMAMGFHDRKAFEIRGTASRHRSRLSRAKRRQNNLNSNKETQQARRGMVELTGRKLLHGMVSHDD